jgi:hypothetical protein
MEERDRVETGDDQREDVREDERERSGEPEGRRADVDELPEEGEPEGRRADVDESPEEGEPEGRRADVDELPEEDEPALLSEDRTSQFEERWRQIQTGFVDHPREAVAQADTLVEDLMQQLTTSFSETRSRLESQWEEGEDASTEDLRVALTRYRTFFNRLLST